MTPDPPIDLANKITVVTGPPDSGKSTFVKWLLGRPEYASHLIYDPMFGYPTDSHNAIRPPTQQTKYRRYEHGNPELNEAVDRFVLVDEDKRPDYFAIDESGRLLPNQQPEGSAMGELNDFNAHYGIGVIVIGQRLAQINSDFENKATRYFCMGVSGKNDRRTLESVHEDFPEYVEASEQYGPTYVRIDDNSICNFGPPPMTGSKAGL